MLKIIGFKNHFYVLLNYLIPVFKITFVNSQDTHTQIIILYEKPVLNIGI